MLLLVLSFSRLSLNSYVKGYNLAAETYESLKLYSIKKYPFYLMHLIIMFQSLHLGN